MWGRKPKEDPLVELVKAVLRGQERQLAIMEQQMEGMRMLMGFWTPDGQPESRTLRDEDEFNMEMERVKANMRWQGEES